MIQSRDDIGNNVNMSPELMVFLLKSDAAIDFRSSSCQTSSDSIIVSAFQRTANTSAVVTYTYNQSGSVTVQGVLCQRGGLSVSVFDAYATDQSSFIQGSTNLLHSALDLNFGTGRIGIDFSKFNFGSTTFLYWKGYLIPRFSETYAFHLSSNGCTSLNISGMVMFTCANVSTKSISLRANELHDVSITYRHSSGIPSLVMFWQSSSQEREIIPSSCW